MGTIIGNVEFYAGPHTVGAPDNLEAIVINFINNAQKSLEIAVQELESRPIAEAIIAARKRKVNVKLVLEQDYLRSLVMKKDPWTPGGENEDNRIIHDAILRTNIDVKSDYNTDIFHQKFIVRDKKSVLTGSTNFTPTCTLNNLNHIVIVNDEEIAKVYSREYSEIQQGHFGKLSEGHDALPREKIISDIRVKVLFAPDHNPEMEIMKQMLKAKKRIDFAIFTFAKSSGIDDTMFRLLELGIPIRGAFDGKQGAHDWAALAELKAKGAELYAIPTKGKLGKLHHKLMVIDDRLIIGGSFNYTAPANLLNDENIIILGDLDSQSAVEKAAQEKLALFARQEIDRIIQVHGIRMT